MARKNNKGFTLVEIVIAIAVLTLLLTPIMKQFAQTMRVSREAKEQQYVNEEATYALEEAQVTPAKDLEARYLQEVAANPSYTFSTSSDAQACILYDEAGWTYNVQDSNGEWYKDAAGNTMNKVAYTIDTYTLGNLEVGPKNTLYDKVITVDNLATQIRGSRKVGELEKGFTIKYNMTESELPDGFTLTNEGAAVELDDNGNVIGIIVEEIDYVGNPNNVNLGNMQNLDYETVAMINGTAANFDEQAEKALFSIAMDELKRIDPEKWEDGILHSTGDNVLQQYGYAPTMEKITKIYIDELTDSEGNPYFLVKADVYYYCEFTLTEKVTTKLSYNVFSQEFKTNKCPDVYFEYQPFVVNIDESGASYDITYAENDYIVVDNYVEGAKIYLYKPYKDAHNAAAGVTDSAYEKKDSYTYTTTAPSADILDDEVAYEQFLLENSVAIHVVKGNSTCELANIYTNLNIEDNADNSQFFVDSSVFNFDFVGTGEDGTVTDSKADYDRSYIKSIAEDTRYDDRLKTVTVMMKPVDDDAANTVRFAGAKGEK